MADPGFPRGGGAKSRGWRQYTILPKFPKNCMKLKEFGPGGRPKFYYVDLSLRSRFQNLSYPPHRSCGKVMFLNVSVIPYRGVWQADTPGRQTQPGRQTPPGRHTPPGEADIPLPRDGHCSGRYTSYWNAFLLEIFLNIFGGHKSFLWGH